MKYKKLDVPSDHSAVELPSLPHARFQGPLENQDSHPRAFTLTSVLARVKAPTLFIVGGNDHPVLDVNRGAMEKMGAETKMEIVPHAGHLFEEAGALEQVVRLACEWFGRHLASGSESH